MATDSGATTPRYELKMVCEERSQRALVASLRLLEDGLRPAFPPRRVQSVYLDDHEGQALDDNVAGIADRQKLRFRWYGDAARDVRGVLERKVRRGRFGWKETLPIDVSVDVEGAPRWQLVRTLREHAAGAWRERLAAQEPVQWLRYRREYWQTADRLVRITLDSELAGTDLRSQARLHAGRASPLPRLLVLECKAAADQDERLERLVQRLPLVADRCSKYVLAAAPAHGPLPSWLGW